MYTYIYTHTYIYRERYICMTMGHQNEREIVSSLSCCLRRLPLGSSSNTHHTTCGVGAHSCRTLRPARAVRDPHSIDYGRDESAPVCGDASHECYLTRMSLSSCEATSKCTARKGMII